jgi:hypothetical protein
MAVEFVQENNRGLSAGFTRFWVVIVVLLAALVRYYDLTNAAIWSDEGFSLMLVTYSPSNILTLSARDVHPPLYYLILHGWVKLFGDGLLAVRGLSALAGLVNVGLGIWLMRLIATRRAAVIAGLFLALLPIAVRYSQDVRMYAILGVWLTGGTIALVCWVRNPERTRYLVAYSLLMAAGFYTHYFTVFYVLSHWLYLGLLQLQLFGSYSYVRRRVWWIGNAVIVLLYFPWLPKVVDQFNNSIQGVGWVPEVSPYTLPSAIWRFFILNDGLILYKPVYWLVPLMFVVLAVAVVYRDRSELRSGVLLVICGFFPLVFVALVSLYRPLFVERYLFFSAVMISLALAFVSDGLKSKSMLVLLVVSVIGVGVVGLGNLYDQQNTMNNPRRIADNKLDKLMGVVNESFAEGDALLVYDVYIFYAASYYNRTGSPVRIYTPVMPDGDSGRPDRYTFSAPMEKFKDETYLDHFDTLVPPSRHVWWLSNIEQMMGAGITFPSGWRLIREIRAGDSLLRLYSVCSNQSHDVSDVCKQPVIPSLTQSEVE